MQSQPQACGRLVAAPAEGGVCCSPAELEFILLSLPPQEASSVPTLPRPASESDFVSAPEAGLAFPRRGHRSDYLVAPLPPLPSPCRSRSPAAQHLPS